MRKAIAFALAAMLLAGALPAVAELQNVLIGGDIRIRGNYYSEEAVRGDNGVRWGALQVPFRPVGTISGPGVSSIFDWANDDNRMFLFFPLRANTSNSLSYVEQRTRLNVRADFTHNVSAFIELDSYDVWGEDFRSDYITGADFRANTADDVEVYQAYIELKDMYDMPLSLKVGRQEISLGSEWLVGVNDASSAFTGLSFDAIRLDYATDMFSVAAFWAKLAENSPVEEDGDVDMYGVYASYYGVEDMTFDAYWMLVRDGRAFAAISPYWGRQDVAGGWLWERIEEFWGVDDYSPIYLNTIGLRGAGTMGAIDFEAEVAYQFGDAGRIGSTFVHNLYGDNKADFDALGANLEVGYTFDTQANPRVFIGGAYLHGDDDRGLSFWEWVVAHRVFKRGTASLSFNRLFSNWEYSEFLDGTDLSNVWILRGGVSAMPTEKLEVLLTASYFRAVDAFEAPWHFHFLGERIAPFSAFSWFTSTNAKSMGWEVGLYATYHYTEDVRFEVGYAHLFVDEGLEQGHYSNGNGLIFNGGAPRYKDSPHYLYAETQISF